MASTFTNDKTTWHEKGFRVPSINLVADTRNDLTLSRRASRAGKVPDSGAFGHFQSCLPNLQATTFKNQPTKLIQLIVNLRLNFHSDSWNFLRSPASMTKGSEPATPPAPTDNLLATGGDHRKKFLDLLCVKFVSEHEGNSDERFIHLARILGRLVLEDIYTTIRIYIINKTNIKNHLQQ